MSDLFVTPSVREAVSNLRAYASAPTAHRGVLAARKADIRALLAEYDRLTRDDVDDPSNWRASYWFGNAAIALDCAVQCCSDPLASKIASQMEETCDYLFSVLKEKGS